MSRNYDKLKNLLKELFQLDQPDLDFGLYRVMHAKSGEVTQFLEKDLLPQVQAAFAQYKTADKSEVEKELAKLIASVEAAGMDPAQSPKVKELRAQLANDAVDVAALESEVYDHLFTFFRRYYSDGDFLAKRVYKPGVYAIPYEGEEVILHWANKDQYYIKTSEYLRNYTFRLRPDNDANPMRVHFRLRDVTEGEHGNVKAAQGKERRFKLATDEPLTMESGELVIHFTYQPDPGKQKELNAAAEASILNTADPAMVQWVDALRTAHRRADGSEAATRLRVHIDRYTARNTFDYFIHRNLGAFLRRELDFFVKNEVLYLDDIESETAPRVEQYLSKIKVIRSIAGKVIAFLSQLEDFQRKLWLKKKFVVETSWCITLDRIPSEFFSSIAVNDAQREAWVRLFAIDKLPGYSVPLTVEFLTANQTLIVDTLYFAADFQHQVLAATDNLDESTTGVLMHSDNFHALNLAGRRFNETLKAVYIDPPYNTASSSIPYKNDYKHSSFASMMRDRLAACHSLLRSDGAIFVSIDKTERTVVEHVLDEVFGSSNHIEELIWTQSTANSQLPNYSTNHEYVEVYARDRASVEADKEMFREPKPGFAEIMDLVSQMNPTYPRLQEVEAALGNLFEKHRTEYREEAEANGQEWEEAKRQDPWRGIYPYSNAEYRDDNGAYVPEDLAKQRNAKLWVWSEIPTGAPASKQSPTTRDPNHLNYRFYKPIHPVTGKPCPHPQSGWKFPAKPDATNADRRSFESLDADKRIAWGMDENKVPRTKGFLHEVETNIGTSVFYEYNDGEAELTNLFGQTGLFLSPKSSKFVRRFVAQATKRDSWFADFFGGSNSSAHGVVRANREDGGSRKFLISEMGLHFDTLTKPRILKALFASEWIEGTPRSRDGLSSCIKVVRLESYEDALNNLELRRTEAQQSLLGISGSGDPKFKEDYVLKYMLEAETRGSHSLLNTEGFNDPNSYKLTVKVPGSDESREMNVDLIETFNWLLGLSILNVARPKAFAAVFERDSERRLRLKGRLKEEASGLHWFRTVTGTTPDGRKTLVIWRKLTGDAEKDNLVLDEWFTKQGFSAKDTEFDLIYVNGSNNLENLKAPDDTWKVRLIEEDFHRLMFETGEA